MRLLAACAVTGLLSACALGSPGQVAAVGGSDTTIGSASATTASGDGVPEEGASGWQFEYLAGALMVLLLIIALVSRKPGIQLRRELRAREKETESSDDTADGHPLE